MQSKKIGNMKFQHTAARRRLVFWANFEKEFLWFQHTAARRRLVQLGVDSAGKEAVSTHSRPKAAGRYQENFDRLKRVSTHSRPKAAGH